MATVEHRVRQGHVWANAADLVGMVCPVCGITYAIPERMQETAVQRGHGEIQWYCPNGHQLGYRGESQADVERERRKRAEERAQAERDLREHTEHRLRAQKGATTKARKRHAAGVCPCCNRSFKQVREHMARMHPDYDPAASA